MVVIAGNKLASAIALEKDKTSPDGQNGRNSVPQFLGGHLLAW
jgi:hypothetical protein